MGLIRLFKIVLVFALVGGAHVGDAQADDKPYQPPKIQTLENGLRFVISSSEGGDGVISIDLLQEVSAQDELPGEEGYHLLLRSIPIEMMLPGLDRLNRVYETWPLVTHGHFGLDPLVLTSIRARGLSEPDVMAALQILSQAARSPNLEGAAVREGFLRARDLSAASSERKRVAFNDRRGGSFATPSGDGRIDDARVQAFLAEQPISLLTTQTAPTNARLRAFAKRVFAPKRAILMVSGAVDPGRVVAQIRQAFGDWQPASEAQAPMRGGLVPKDMRMALDRETETPTIEVQIKAGGTITDPWLTDTRPSFERKLDEVILREVLGYSRDLVDDSRSEKVAWIRLEQGQAVVDLRLTLSRLPAPVLRDRLRAVFVELHRLKQHGLPGQSIRAIKSSLKQSVRQRDRKKQARPASITGAVGEAMGTLVDQGYAGKLLFWSTAFVVRQSQSDWHLSSEALTDFVARTDQLTAGMINQRLQVLLGGDQVRVALHGTAADLSLFDGLNALYAEVGEEEYEAPISRAAVDFKYSNFGVPGRVTVRERFTHTEDTVALTFANNVLLVYQHRPDAAESARVDITIGTPGSFRSAAQRKWLHMINREVSKLPLGQHSALDIADLGDRFGSLAYRGFAENGVSLAPGLTYAGVMDAEVPILLKMAAAKLTDTVFDEQILEDAIAAVKVIQPDDPIPPYIIHELMGRLPRSLGGSPPAYINLWGGALPEHIPSVKQLTDFTKAIFKDHAIRVIYAGPRSEAEIVAEVAKTLGALPKRAPFSPLELDAGTPIPVGQTLSASLPEPLTGAAFSMFYPVTMPVSPQRRLARVYMASGLAMSIHRRFKQVGLEALIPVVRFEVNEFARTGHHIRITVHGDPAQVAQAEALLTGEPLSPENLLEADFRPAIQRAVTRRASLEGVVSVGFVDLSRFRDSVYPLPGDDEQKAFFETVSVAQLRALMAEEIRPENRLIIRFGY